MGSEDHSGQDVEAKVEEVGARLEAEDQWETEFLQDTFVCHYYFPHQGLFILREEEKEKSINLVLRRKSAQPPVK